MYKAIRDNKVIAINDSNMFPLLVYDFIEQDTEHTVDDYDQYNGEYLLKSEIPLPTNEEQSKKRREAYTQEVDPITAHISRLKDEEQTEDIIAEIETLKAERSEKVIEIKEKYPYYENAGE